MSLNSKQYSLEEAINKLFAYKYQEGYELIGIHKYEIQTGDIAYCKVRLKNPISGDKCLYPVHIDQNDNYVVKEPDFDIGKKPLYMLAELSKSHDEPVFVVEGEPCVDALMELGCTATTSGSWNSAKLADWALLAGKNVVIWADADQCGDDYAQMVAEILLQMHCKVSMIDITKLNMAKSEDCVDWIYKHPAATKQDILDLPTVECTISEEVDELTTKSKMLLELVKDIELFHDEKSISYATIVITGRNETMPIRSENFINWLSQLFWNTHKEPVSNFVRSAAVDLLEAKARYEGKCHKVFTRVGQLNGEIYIFLANEKNQVIKLSSDGWNVLENCPLKFVKSRNMRPLPIPVHNGNISLLWKHINIQDKYKILLIGWLMESLRLDTEYPILLLHGCQGSAKSTTQEFLRDLIDPNVSNLRGAPRNSDDIIIAAANNYLISYNNISVLTKANQDDLCTVSTGGGIGRRKIYTDLDESLCEVKRPVILNGIHNPISARDLISRCIIIELPEIKDSCRKPGTQLRSEFAQDIPHILGGLYDLYVSVINVLPTVSLAEMPRLADFALLGTAIERVLVCGEGAFLNAFNNNIEDSMCNTLDSQPILWSLNKFIDDYPSFKGTFGKLLDELNSQVYKAKSAQDWPGSAKALAIVLKDVAPILWKMNISIRFIPTRSNRGNVVEINRI